MERKSSIVGISDEIITPFLKGEGKIWFRFRNLPGTSLV